MADLEFTLDDLEQMYEEAMAWQPQVDPNSTALQDDHLIDSKKWSNSTKNKLNHE